MPETKNEPRLTAEEQIAELLKRGKARGYLTYEEMNDSLPDDIVSPERLDRILDHLA